MKVRHIALGVAISLASGGSAWAQSTWSQTNTNINTNNTSGTGVSAGATSFSLNNGNMTITQNNTNDFNAFCQFFSFSFGMTRIIQIVQGNSVTQSFGSTADPVDDPCL